MEHVAIGIDVGGSGIKGAAVNTQTGELLTGRHKERTPKGGSPADIAQVLGTMAREIRQELAAARTHGPAHTRHLERRDDAEQPANTEQSSLESLPVGVALPGVIKQGTMLTAANIDRGWIGLSAADLCAEATGITCSVVNDADAAGLAESHYGAARGLAGSTMVLTFGTGIGSALVHDGVLVPNFELGHLHLDGHSDIEQYASARVISRDNVPLTEWARRAARYIAHLEVLFHPDRFVLGGGISRDANHYLPFDGVTAPVIPAHFDNNAGIVGAAWLAHSDTAQTG